MHSFAQHNKTDVICVVETWLTESVTDAELSCNGKFNVIRRDRGSHAGGVLILVRKDIPCVQVTCESSCDQISEFIAVDFVCDSSVRLIVAYSPGTADTSAEDLLAMQNLCGAFEKLCLTEYPVIIAADMNCPNVLWPDKCKPNATPREKYFLEFVMLNSMCQLVTEPTRPASGNLVDVILCSDGAIDGCDITVIPCFVHSDHNAIQFPLHVSTHSEERVMEFDFDKADYDLINQSLLATDWEGMLASCASVDETYNYFIDYVYNLVEAYVPKRSNRREKPIQSYIARIHRKINNCAPHETEKKEKLEKQLSAALLRQRRILEQSISRSNDAARFFGYAASRLKLKDDIAVLATADGRKLTENKEKANLLKDVFQQTYVQNVIHDKPPVLRPDNIDVVDNVDLSEENIIKIINEMKPKKSLTPELLPATFFQKVAPGLAAPLRILFSRSMDAGKIPEVYRKAWIAPVHKGGTRSDPANKRPVSLTAVSCKILERIIAAAVMENAERQDLITPHQYAYRRGRSTTDCLLKFFNEVALSTNAGVPVDVIYCDFKSAFETMSHELLLSVLPAKGIGPRLVMWISDFLRNRTFQVKVNGTLSDVGHATTGCPQGTVLGSLLFLLYIDEVKHILPPEMKFGIYADDVKFYLPINDDNDRATLQTVLDDFATWTMKMGLRLSIHKCGVMHLGSRNGHHDYYMNGSLLAKLDSVKDLGVRYSANMNFGEQVAHVVTKGSLLCNWLLRAFVIKSPSVYLRLYKTHVLPLVLYGCQTWSPQRASDRETLERMQRRFLRMVETRCNLSANTLELVTVSELMQVADFRQLSRVMRNDELFNEMFNLTATNSRSGFIVSAKATARSERVANSFAWRMVKRINGPR